MNKLPKFCGDWHRLYRLIQTAALTSIILMSPVYESLAAPPASAHSAQSSGAMLDTYYAWINAPWTDDDGPYQRLRQEIDQAISSKANPYTLLNKYQRSLEKAPSDPQAQFAYYYAAYQAATWSKAPAHNGFDVLLLGNLFIAIIRAPHPHTYNYARLAFLCGQYNFNDANQKMLGMRLVQRDPSDYDVKYYTTAILVLSARPGDWALAQKYANSLLTSYPNKPSSHAIAGEVHYEAWLGHRNKQDASEAISQYQRYLQLTPITSISRGPIEARIAQMQNG